MNICIFEISVWFSWYIQAVRQQNLKHGLASVQVVFNSMLKTQHGYILLYIHVHRYMVPELDMDIITALNF